MTKWQPSLRRHPGPKYLAIVRALQEDRDAGRLRPGDRLPTHRDLAASLRVTVGTVSRAYAEAERRGLVRGEVGRGTFVLAAAVAAEAFPLDRAAGADLIDLARNLPVMPAAREGSPEFRAALEAVAAGADLPDLLGYQPPAGAARHRAAGAAWVARSGLTVDPDRVLVSAGIQHGMLVALGALARPGDLVLTEELTYPGIRSVAGILGLRLKGIAMDGEGILPDAVDEVCRRRTVRALYCLPTLQNPTTRTLSEARRRELAEVARRHGLLVLEDDCYGTLPAAAPSPIATHYPEGTIYLTGLGKSLAPGLRVGYLAAPAAEVGRLTEAIRASTWMATPLTAEVARRWIEDGTADGLLQRARREIEARHRLARRILDGVSFELAEGSLHLWLHLRDPWRSPDLVDQAHRRGVAVTPGEAFSAGRDIGGAAVRVCLGAPGNRDEVERGLRVLAEVLEGRFTPYLSVL